MQKNRNSSKLKFFLSDSFNRGVLFVLAVLISLGIVISAYPYAKYEYEVGDISTNNIKAPYDIENEFETESKAVDNKNEIQEYIVDLKDSVSNSFEKANEFFQFIYDLRKFYDSDMEIGDFSSTYQLTLDDFKSWLNTNDIVLADGQMEYLANELTNSEYERFNNITYDIIQDITKNDIDEDNLSEFILTAQNSYRQKGLDTNIVSIGQALMRSIIFVNREYDGVVTNGFKEKAYFETLVNNKIMISKGEFIVTKGERISQNIYKILESTNLNRKSGLMGYINYLFILLLIMLCVFFFVTYIKLFYKKLYKGTKEYIILLVILALSLGLSRVGMIFSPYFILILLAPMLVSILLDLRVAIIFNFIVCIILSIIIPDVPLILIYFIGGSFAAYMVHDKRQRAKLSIAGIIASFITTLLFVVVEVLFGEDLIETLKDCYLIFISGTLAIIISVGLLPFFESVFNIVTPFKLLELSNPNHPLLKRLLMEAPGTYHHSLMVGNLAESATRKIGGDALLARVGAYYHDIGKIERANFFTENQISENPHDKMSPKLSAFVITSHVTDGIKLANEHKLPSVIKDIIISHHGNTMVSYFYHKAKKDDKNESVNEADFRYKAPRPSTREAAVVLLADSVEAAVRSLEDKSKGKVEGFIRKIIKGKLDDGQLDLCDLSLKDLNDIAQGFSDVLSGYFHERIQYPDNEKR